jgi:hypothetical protein
MAKYFIKIEDGMNSIEPYSIYISLLSTLDVHLFLTGLEKSTALVDRFYKPITTLPPPHCQPYPMHISNRSEYTRYTYILVLLINRKIKLDQSCFELLHTVNHLSILEKSE